MFVLNLPVEECGWKGKPSGVSGISRVFNKDSGSMGLALVGDHLLFNPFGDLAELILLVS